MKINWASAIDPEANIVQFRARRRYEPLGNGAWVFAAEDANQYEDVDLMAGTYEYRVAAIRGFDR